ncbi:hypothetical protein CERZMDRAFT_89181 [Cercospora zeae-maydis SCOH1-5]|uniref:Uncharacterized protein n=1 Tax=Cercospora zeae-maydis SCOH1-5 TaxID=717836 RepID=A0A6A6EYS2_9PEZI|nr:hypothetical protein CERZMDRAFT_89181 [Cercospora zeae-maydis SCOH1-5]
MESSQGQTMQGIVDHRPSITGSYAESGREEAAMRSIEAGTILSGGRNALISRQGQLHLVAVFRHRVHSSVLHCRSSKREAISPMLRQSLTRRPVREEAENVCYGWTAERPKNAPSSRAAVLADKLLATAAA